MSFWKIAGLIAGACLAPLTGGTSLIAATAVCGGVGLVAGYLLDKDEEKKEKENQQLVLNSQASREIKEEVNNLQNQRTQETSQLNNLEQQLSQKQNKLNDPNTPEQEKTQVRSEIASIVSQKSSLEQKIKSYDTKIDSLLKNMPGGKASESQVIDTQKLLIIGGACLAIYLLVIKDKDK